LVEAALKHGWPVWPPATREYAQGVLGQAFRLKGLLLLRGEKIRRNPGQALTLFKYAADKYRDDEAAWLAAQFHTRGAAPAFAHVAKPHAQAHDWYMRRARKQGAEPVDAPACDVVQP
jgi:TPR repeat protein